MIMKNVENHYVGPIRQENELTMNGWLKNKKIK